MHVEFLADGAINCYTRLKEKGVEMPNLNKRVLGRTGVEVTTLVYGAMEL